MTAREFLNERSFGLQLSCVKCRSGRYRLVINIVAVLICNSQLWYIHLSDRYFDSRGSYTLLFYLDILLTTLQKSQGYNILYIVLITFGSSQFHLLFIQRNGTAEQRVVRRHARTVATATRTSCPSGPPFPPLRSTPRHPQYFK